MICTKEHNWAHSPHIKGTSKVFAIPAVCSNRTKAGSKCLSLLKYPCHIFGLWSIFKEKTSLDKHTSIAVWRCTLKWPHPFRVNAMSTLTVVSTQSSMKWYNIPMLVFQHSQHCDKNKHWHLLLYQNKRSCYFTSENKGHTSGQSSRWWASPQLKHLIAILLNLFSSCSTTGWIQNGSK